jgi:hypothetical protein
VSAFEVRKYLYLSVVWWYQGGLEKAEKILMSSELEIVERIDLKGLEEQHVLFYCKLYID